MDLDENNRHFLDEIKGPCLALAGVCTLLTSTFYFCLAIHSFYFFFSCLYIYLFILLLILLTFPPVFFSGTLTTPY